MQSKIFTGQKPLDPILKGASLRQGREKGEWEEEGIRIRRRDGNKSGLPALKI